MRHLIIVIVLAVTTLSCLNEASRTAPIITAEQLQGDWVTASFPSEIADSLPLIFCFEDSLCSYMKPWGNYTRYALRDDTLVIYDRHRLTDKPYSLRYEITGLTSKELRMVPLQGQAAELLKRYREWTGDTLVLNKILPKNQIVPKRIVFDSSPCFGTCPILALEIDGIGNVKFLGTNYTGHKGGFTGRLSADQYAHLLRQIRALPLDNLKLEYAAPWTDDQTCCLMIEHADGKISSCAYGFDKEPVALRILFHKLTGLENMISLKADNTVKSYLLQEEHLRYLLPPPVPKTEANSFKHP